MTEEEIINEAQERVNCCTPLYPECFIQGYIASAKPREKRIADLEKENEQLRNNGFTVSAMTEQQLKVAIEKGEQLEKENNKLLDVINDQDVKIADFEQQIEKMKNCENCSLHCASPITIEMCTSNNHNKWQLRR